MATAPRLKASLLDPEMERSKVFDPTKPKQAHTTVRVSTSSRNPKDAIKRFEMEKAYGLGRRRKNRRTRKKSRK